MKNFFPFFFFTFFCKNFESERERNTGGGTGEKKIN